jgi:hypothetical protein
MVSLMTETLLALRAEPRNALVGVSGDHAVIVPETRSAPAEQPGRFEWRRMRDGGVSRRWQSSCPGVAPGSI